MGYRELVAWQHLGLSYRYWQRGDFEPFRAGSEQALHAAREVGEPTTESSALVFLAGIDLLQGRAEQALESLQDTLALVMRTGAAMTLPYVEEYTAWALAALGRHTESADLIQTMLEGPTADYAWVVPMLEWLLARVHLAQGDPAQARRHADNVLAAVGTLPNAWHEARGHHVLARIACADRRWAEAERHAHLCLDLLVEHDLELDYAIALDALAEAAAGLESHEEAARLLGASARAHNERGLVRWTSDAEHFNALERTLQAALGDTDYAEAAAEGTELTTREAIAWARRRRGSRRRPTAGWESLTPTELTVVGFIAEGLTNPQIGERMFITRGTVKVHLSNILRKLDMSTRTEIAAEAARRDATLP